VPLCRIMPRNHNRPKRAIMPINYASLQRLAQRLTIPTPEQQLQLIQSVHDDHESHPGPQTTARILSEHYHWRGMHGQIKQYVAGCLHCQKQKQRDIAAYGQLTDPVEPTECGSAWGIDYVCSLGCEAAASGTASNQPPHGQYHRRAGVARVVLVV
jgi:hypothetical protein